MKPWPLGIAIVLAVFIAIQALMITIAAHAFEGPDDPQYYNEGLHYNQELDARQRQAGLEWQALPVIAPDTVGLDLHKVGQPVGGARVTVTVGRPATRREDLTLHLAETSPGRYRTTCHLAPGVWVVTFDVSRGSDFARYVVRQSL